MPDPETKHDYAPWRDPIVAEVRRAREELFASARYDLRELCRQLREGQKTCGHPVVTTVRSTDPDAPNELA